MSDKKPPPPPSARALDAARAQAPAQPAGDSSVHDAVQQQVRAILADSDLAEDEKQQILIALACPCCGTGGLSLSMKLGGSGKIGF